MHRSRHVVPPAMVVCAAVLMVGIRAFAEADCPASDRPHARGRCSPPESTARWAAGADALATEALARSEAAGFARAIADDIGARPTGSRASVRAVDWAEKTMKRAGLRSVRRESFPASAWERGDERVEIEGDPPRRLHAFFAAGSASTGPRGAGGVVASFTSIESLKASAAGIGGKVVVFDRKIEPSPNFDGVVPALKETAEAIEQAVSLGAAGVLVRSFGTGYHRLPHAGTVHYAPARKPVPVAFLAAEDAELLGRLSERAEVRVRMRSSSRGRAVTDWNVLGEVPGSDLRDEIVLVSAHLDSWDLGSGALDDAAGCGLVLDVARSIRAAGLVPRRTMRFVLFGSEELGTAGASAYARTHAGALPRHVAALEADSGAGAPTGYLVAGEGPARVLVERWASRASKLPRRVTTTSLVGPDLVPLQIAGVPVLSVDQDLTGYFEFHHTEADTFDKIDAGALSLAAAALAHLSWAAANADERLPPPLPPRW